MKVCRGCGNAQSSDDFLPVGAAGPVSGMLCGECRAKGRRELLKSKYGMSVEDYEALLARQGGACGICKRPAALPGRGFHVDHDHASGEIRGILCRPCNKALGLFRDDPSRILAAIEYLRQS